MMIHATNESCVYGLLLLESIPSIWDHLHHRKPLDLNAGQLGGKTLDHVCERNIPQCKSGIVYLNAAVNNKKFNTEQAVCSLTLSVCCPSPFVHLFLTRRLMKWCIRWFQPRRMKSNIFQPWEAWPISLQEELKKRKMVSRLAFFLAPVMTF